MSEIEKMQRYIERTPMKKADNYFLTYGEASELMKTAKDVNALFEVVDFVFNYGKAKGYRAAKAERRAAV